MNIKIIHNEKEILRFFNDCLPEISSNESYFLSLSIRRKYFTEEEKALYSLGGREMFDKKQIVSHSGKNFLRAIKGFEVDEAYFKDKLGKTIPKNKLTVYANLRTTNSIKALREFNAKSFDRLTSNPNKMGDLNNLLLSCYQRSSGSKKFIDIDFDIPKDRIDLVRKLVEEINKRNHIKDFDSVNYKVIETNGGYHLLIEGKTIKSNIKKAIDFVNEIAKKELDKYEIILNKNAMVPIPGTYQAGFPVKFVDII